MKTRKYELELKKYKNKIKLSKKFHNIQEIGLKMN